MQGFDISSNNHAGEPFNFLQAKDDGYEVVYVKATQGNNYLNEYLIADVRDAFNNGLKVGVYHFYDAAHGTPEEQAQWFITNGLNQVEEWAKLVPVLDYETLTTAAERDTFLRTLARECGVYTTRSIHQSIGYGSPVGWLAWPGWTPANPVPTDTAIVQTGQVLIEGIGGNPNGATTTTDVDTIVNAEAIGAAAVPTPLPPKEEDEKMLESVIVTVNGVQKLVTTIIVPGNEHVVQMTQNVNDLGLPATDANTQIIDITDAFPPQVPA